MKSAVFDMEDVAYLDDVLYMRQGGIIRPQPAGVLAKIKPRHLAIWCNLNAVYVLPTFELLEFLRKQIGGRPAMEIGAGKSCLGRPLGIQMVDNKMQTWPRVRDHYLALGQRTIDYPGDVEEIDANLAIEKFKPAVVVGGYITQRGTIAVPQSNPHGPDEEKIVKAGIKYIHVGTITEHDKKKILKLPHRELSPRWLFTRTFRQEDSRIWIWNE